ncbi:MAG: hypothetical protein RSF67_08455 [Clostridia bacterium]
MNIKCSKPTISDYSFLRLLTSSIILNNENPIIENHQLEKDLYPFYSRPEYNTLFEDICKKEDITNDNSYIDLSCAFQTAYAFGLILQIHDVYSQLKSLINYSADEAIKIQSEYDIKTVESINNLCEELFGQKVINQGNMLIKKK